MARFEMHNHGRVNVTFPYRKDVIILTAHRTEQTDDPELARIAGGHPFIGVKENIPDLEKMTKKELVQRAVDLGISNAANTRKAKLVEEIESAEGALIDD